ncbi:MAG: hypothetical protein HRU15_05935, partial [Planctomycetes bacterium]|nr:hypothetical protein [Planctomycetota bacterium]
LALDRAGLVGEDGETHQGLYDIAWSRALPGVVLMAARDAQDLEHMLRWAYLQRDDETTDNVAAAYIIRYPKEVVPEFTWGLNKPEKIELGKSSLIQQGDGSILIMAYGAMLRYVWQAMEKLGDDAQGITLIDPRFAKPIDCQMVQKMREHTLSICIEDHSIVGGFGSAVLESAAAQGIQAQVECWAVDDQLIAHASRAQQLDDQGLSADALYQRLYKKIHHAHERVIPFDNTGS